MILQPLVKDTVHDLCKKITVISHELLFTCYIVLDLRQGSVITGGKDQTGGQEEPQSETEYDTGPAAVDGITCHAGTGLGHIANLCR